MQKLEAVIKVLRYVSANRQQSYSFEEFTEMLESTELKHQIIKDATGTHCKFDFDPKIEVHFTFENNHYEVTKYNIIHGILNEITEYYNELEVTSKIDESELEICLTDFQLLKTVGIERWEDKEVSLQRVLKIFHDDVLVAAFMLLKYLGKEEDKTITYIERHSDVINYREYSTDLYIEMYNKKYERLATLDIINMHLIEDKYERLHKALETWDQKRNQQNK